MNTTALTHPMRTWGHLRSLRDIVGVCFIALLTVFAFGLLGVSWDAFFFLLACTIFLALLCFACSFSRRALAGERESVLLGTLLIWAFLMVSETIFTHYQSAQSAAQGSVGRSALFQAISWILSLAVLALISCFRPAYLRRLFSGPFKWASIFAIVAVLSSPLSPKPLYSLALAFKLCVIVLTLCAIGEAIANEAGISKLFSALFWGMLISVTAQFMAPFFRSGPIFEGGRLGWMVGLSGTCGLLLLLSILFLWLTKKPRFLVCAVYSVAVMMLAGTKGGIVASFISLMMFFLLLKKPAQALAVSFVLTGVLIFCAAFTPLGKSLEKYSESDNAATLTGRTGLWQTAWPTIERNVILGKGYRSARFVSVEVPGAFREADNMHNSFMEVLYNNGLAGLIPILVMNILIVVNLRRVIVRPPTLQVRYYAAAALALYVHLFVWGLVATTFGGPPDNRFMTFFAILIISVFLRARVDKEYWKTIYGRYSS